MNKNLTKLNKISFVSRNKRSSKYRGVSKNRNQWQILMMINKKKIIYREFFFWRACCYRIYDVLILKIRGNKSRTNYKYNSKQIKNICEAVIDIKAENIYDIFSLLIFLNKFKFLFICLLVYIIYILYIFILIIFIHILY